MKDRNIRAKMIKPLEENIGVSIHDLGLDTTLKTQVTKEKIDKLDFTKI